MHKNFQYWFCNFQAEFFYSVMLRTSFDSSLVLTLDSHNQKMVSRF